jgi:hypothetical protein
MATRSTGIVPLPPAGSHQVKAVDEIMNREAVLVEYGTGTGKTRVIAEATEAIIAAGEAPVLVLVPNSLLEQTTEEFERWVGPAWVARHLMVLSGKYSIDLRRQQIKYARHNVYLLSHEAMSFPLIREALLSRHWCAVFLDEASRFRNYSNRTKTLINLGKRADTRYALTGNLAPRSPTDVWYCMNWLTPRLFGTSNRTIFQNSYCLLGGFEGRQVIGIRPDKLKEFRAVMDAHRITCDLRDLRTMPTRVLHQHLVNLPHQTRKAYTTMQETLRLEIERVDDATFTSHVKTYATRLQRLQEITSGFARNVEGDVVYLPSAKTTAMLDLIDDEPDVPTIVWAWWVPEITAIKAMLAKRGIPHVVLGEEKNAVEQFMKGRVNVFIAQLARGGYGLNLTRATRMIYHSLPWSLDVYLQSQERNMRLTTTADRLEIVHLTTRDTVDAYVRNRLLDRADISSQLTRSQALELLRT